MRNLAASALALLLLALAGPAFAATLTLSGDVTYRERIALPEGGSLTVSLIDLAMPDLPRVSAAAAIGGPGQVPIAFTLDFDESIILPEHEYALEAIIADADGAIWFKTAETYSVDPLQQVDPVDILVSRASFDEQRPRMVNRAHDPLDLPIMNHTWQALSIGGKPVRRGIVSSLNIATDMRAGGRGGCNSWFAQTNVDAEHLVFNTVASTRAACVSDATASQEDSFFAALAATRKWVIDVDGNLLLVNKNGDALAVLEKSPF